MLGPQSKPHLSMKAGETQSMLPFVVGLLEENLPKYVDAGSPDAELECKLLLQAGRAALAMNSIFALPRKLNNNDCQMLMDNYMLFCTCYERCNGTMVPKHHLMVHLIQQSLVKGNPSFYATWNDESLNGLLRKIAVSCHRLTWTESVHVKCNILYTLAKEQAIKQAAQGHGEP